MSVRLSPVTVPCSHPIDANGFRCLEIHLHLTPAMFFFLFLFLSESEKKRALICLTCAPVWEGAKKILYSFFARILCVRICCCIVCHAVSPSACRFGGEGASVS